MSNDTDWVRHFQELGADAIAVCTVLDRHPDCIVTSVVRAELQRITASFKLLQGATQHVGH